MGQHANAQFLTPTAWQDAAQGIVAPQLRTLAPGALLFRFGASEDRVWIGRWWLDVEQFAQIGGYAAQHRLAVPHAARVLSATAHRWNGMRVLVRAQVLRPLGALAGAGRYQQVTEGGRIMEHLDPPTPGGRAPEQLFIPGLDDAALNAQCLKRAGVIGHFGEGDSHIGGVPGIPAGAVLQ